MRDEPIQCRMYLRYTTAVCTHTSASEPCLRHSALLSETVALWETSRCGGSAMSRHTKIGGRDYLQHGKYQSLFKTILCNKMKTKGKPIFLTPVVTGDIVSLSVSLQNEFQHQFCGHHISPTQLVSQAILCDRTTPNETQSC